MFYVFSFFHAYLQNKIRERYTRIRGREKNNQLLIKLKKKKNVEKEKNERPIDRPRRDCLQLSEEVSLNFARAVLYLYTSRCACVRGREEKEEKTVIIIKFRQKNGNRDNVSAR